MKNHFRYFFEILAGGVFVLGLSACQQLGAQGLVTVMPTNTPSEALVATATLGATATIAATASQTPTVTLTPSVTPFPAAVGPDNFPANVNPLTGLAVADVTRLERFPILVKVSNESNHVRPQSGLSFADQVWEHQMEGYALTRYSAVFLGENPEWVGSVRSTRLIDVRQLVDMYQAILVTSGGSSNKHAPETPPRIRELLFEKNWAERVVSPDYIGGHVFVDPYLVRRPDTPHEGIDFYHTLFASLPNIWDYAAVQEWDQPPQLHGLLFDYRVPADGTETSEVAVDYPGRGPKHVWRYDAALGSWLSFTQQENSGDTEPTADDDFLTKTQLAFENVVVVYAPHTDADFIEDEGGGLSAVDVELTGTGKAVLLRDGQRYEVTWQRAKRADFIQFMDAAGHVIAFHPGQTWFQLVNSLPRVPEVTYLP